MLSMYVCVCVYAVFFSSLLFIRSSFFLILPVDARGFERRHRVFSTVRMPVIKIPAEDNGASPATERIMIECKWHDDGQYIEIYGYKLYGYMYVDALFFRYHFFLLLFFCVLSDVSPRCVFLVCECIKCRI